MTWSTECSFRDCCWCFCFHWICLGFSVFCLFSNETHNRFNAFVLGRMRSVYVTMRRTSVFLCACLCVRYSMCKYPVLSWTAPYVCMSGFVWVFETRIRTRKQTNQQTSEIQRSAYSTGTKHNHAIYWASYHSTRWTNAALFSSIRLCPLFSGIYRRMFT